MYYITNQNNQIIAIDPSLLALLEIENIDELYRGIALGDIKFSSLVEDEKVTIATAQKEETYDVENNTLTGMLGNITLVQIQVSEENDDTAPPIEEILLIGSADKNAIDDASGDITLEDHLSAGSDDIMSLEDEIDEKVEISKEEAEEKTIGDENIEEKVFEDITFKDDHTADLQDLDLMSIKDDNDVSDDLDHLSTGSDDMIVLKDKIDEKVEISKEEAEEKTIADENIEEKVFEDITFKDDHTADLQDLDLMSIKDDNDVSDDLDHLSTGSDDMIVLKDKIDEKVEISKEETEEKTIADENIEEKVFEDITFKDDHTADLQDLALMSIEDDTDISDDLDHLLIGSDDIMSLKDEIDEKVEISEDDDALFDLILPTAAEETIDEISLTENEQVETADDSQAPIIIDVKNISQIIGISTEDYNVFLNEYINTALSLEKDLLSTQEKTRSYAIGTLSHLSNVLHLPVVSEILTQIENNQEANKDADIESFYATLARLTTSPLEEETLSTTELKIASEVETDVSIAADSIGIDSIVLQEEEPRSRAEAESVTTTTEGFGTINLDDVKPIHFDFQLEEAAKDLNLPTELIEEFVHDFVGQARIETEKMLEAYEKGDLETIQKIGHLLKGTSSNLRINPLSDTLYEIQFCNDSSKLKDMIKHYWGHFLSLETQINVISK